MNPVISSTAIPVADLNCPSCSPWLPNFRTNFPALLKTLRVSVVYKDQEFVKNNVELYLGEMYEPFMEQIQRDSELLKQFNVMDYSLLIGIHHRTNLTDHSQVRPFTSLKTQIANTVSETKYDDESEFDGILSSDSSCVYYFGIIDVLQKYNTKKALEHSYKKMTVKGDLISSVPPDVYSSRFLEFLSPHLKQYPGLIDSPKAKHPELFGAPVLGRSFTKNKIDLNDN